MSSAPTLHENILPMTRATSSSPFTYSTASTNGSYGINVALIGGGMIAEQHLVPLTTGLPGINVNLTGVCDLSPALARFQGDRFNIPYWTTDVRKLLDGANADIVHVLTPAHTHFPIVHECLEHGCHVIVEKPIALSNADFKKLWSLARRKNVNLTESHNYRFNAPVLRLDKLIDAGRLGVIEEVEIRMTLDIRAGGRYADPNLPHPSHTLPAGVIHEFISHLCYLLLHFLSADPRRADLIKAAWRNHGGGTLFKYDDLDALVMFGNRHGRIRFRSQGWPNEFSIQVRGSGGTATAELFQPAFQFVSHRAVGQHLTPLVNALAGAGSLTASGCGNIWRKVKNQTPYEGLTRFLQVTYEAIQRGESLPIGFQEMDRTTRLIDALLKPEHQI